MARDSGHFRRSYVSHYLSAHAEWAAGVEPGRGTPIMRIRGETFPGKVTQAQRDVLPS